MQKNYLVLN